MKSSQDWTIGLEGQLNTYDGYRDNVLLDRRFRNRYSPHRAGDRDCWSEYSVRHGKP